MSDVETSCERCHAPLPVAATGDCPTCGGPTTGPAPAPARASGRGWVKPALVGGLLVGTIGIAGVVISRNDPAGLLRSLRPPTPAQAQAPAVKPVAPEARLAPDGVDLAASRTRLTVIRPDKAGARPVVALGRPSGARDHMEVKGSDQGILLRELIRQAVLVAARDELGLATRDEVLDDVPPPRAEGGVVAEVASWFRTGGAGRALIRRGEGASAETIASREIPIPETTNASFEGLVALAESLSRAEFPAALKKLGLDGAPNRVRDDADLPDRVEDRLRSLSFFDALAAVRDLHAAIRADGESPARLGALARGYALLGVLSEFHWHPAHKAYKARALLYAQRQAARTPADPSALRSRAYVEALIGRPRPTLADLAEADKLASAREGKGRAAPPPSWVAPIRAYADRDLGRLDTKEGPDAKLAALLRMMALEYPTRTRIGRDAARDVLPLAPECYRAVDTLCRLGGLGDLHLATAYGPQVLTQLLPAKLKTMGGLPESVRRRLESRPDELGLTEALGKAGAAGEDDGEPSSGALAHLIRETRFVQAWRRLNFMRNLWSVPGDDYWADVRPFVAGHRYLPFLESYTLPPAEATAALAGLVKDLDVTDVETTAYELYRLAWDLPKPDGHGFGTIVCYHSDEGTRDLSMMLEYAIAKPLLPWYARGLLEVDPKSAVAMAVLVENDWPKAEAELAAWQARVGDAPAMLAALGRKYTALGRMDDAIRVRSRLVTLSPDRSAFEGLAENYKAKGDVDRWRSTLDRYLKEVEPTGLEHAEVQVRIANALMEQKRYKEAQPYAEAAAQTWAGWAIDCAAACDEALEDWDKAELWNRRNAERYPESRWAAWYLFCHRTGHGNIEEARALLEPFMAAAEGNPGVINPELAGYFHWADGDSKKARDAFARAFDAKPGVLPGIMLGLVSDELGDLKRRDSSLEIVCTQFRDKAPKFIQIIQMMRDSFADGGKVSLNLAAVDKILDGMIPAARPNADFFVGRYLLNRGKPDAARPYLKRCADSPLAYTWVKAVAAEILAREGPRREKREVIP